MMGSVAGATWVQVGWLAAYASLSAVRCCSWRAEIDVLALGDDAAAGLGVDVDRAGRRAYVIASLLAAATVAAAGLVGFVGLVVPHLVRRAPVGATERSSPAARACRRDARHSRGSRRAHAPRAERAAARRGDGARRRAVLSSSSCGATDDPLRRRRACDIRARPRRGRRRVVRGPGGAITAVVGPNGSGKSTLVRALLGRVPLSAASSRSTAEDVSAPRSPRAGASRRRRVAARGTRVPAARREYVALGRHPHPHLWSAAGPAGAAAVARARSTRPRCVAFADRTTDELSGGRVAARAHRARARAGRERARAR